MMIFFEEKKDKITHTCKLNSHRFRKRGLFILEKSNICFIFHRFPAISMLICPIQILRSIYSPPQPQFSRQCIPIPLQSPPSPPLSSALVDSNYISRARKTYMV